MNPYPMGDHGLDTSNDWEDARDHGYDDRPSWRDVAADPALTIPAHVPPAEPDEGPLVAAIAATRGVGLR